MGLTANPFHPVTKELLTSYRDAYLRGDLSRTNSELVDAYLKANTSQGDKAFQRFHNLKATGHRVRPVGWVSQQFQLMRTEPVRFRRRAGSLLLLGVMLSGMVFAANTSEKKITPMAGKPLINGLLNSSFSPAAVASAELALATTVLRGRVLNENGQPLAGATVLDKESGRAVSTNAEGNYMLLVPANRPARLQYGFGGYHEEEVQTQSRHNQDVTLLPDTDKLRRLQKRHWWQF